MATKMDKARVVVLLALAAGSSKRAAAGKAGIAYRTLNRWQQEDEFADAIEVATGQGRDVYESILREAAAKDWRAALAAYEIIYEGGVRAGRRNGSADDLIHPAAPEALVVTDDEARERVAKVLSILHDALGSREAVQQVVEANVRRLRLVQD
jgi:transposase